MFRRRSSILSLVVCTTLLAGCDNHLAVTPADDGAQADGSGLAPADEENPVAVTPEVAQAQTPDLDGEDDDVVLPEPVHNGAQKDEVPEGAEPVPAPQEAKPPLPLPRAYSAVPEPHVEIIAMLKESEAAMSTTSESSEAPVVKTSDDSEAADYPAPAPKAKPNVGPFVPNAKSMWLSMTPGSDIATLEIGVKPNDVALIPEVDGHKTLMVDGDGLGKFKAMPLKAVTDPEFPERRVVAGREDLHYFSTPFRIDVNRMAAVMTEYNNRDEREVVEFVPGTPKVAYRHQAHRIDVDAFLKGKKVDISLVAQMSPLGTLGARPVRVDRDRSLMIRDLRVIEDPRRTVNPCKRPEDDALTKIWGFGHLMREMSKQAGIPVQQFVESWLSTFMHTQTILGKDGKILDQINSRRTGNALRRGVIRDWRRRSGGRHLDLRIAPFRLLAVVYRPDLGTRSPLLAPEQNSAGQLRFVFGMMRTRDWNGDGDTLDFFETCSSVEASVIVEYNVPAQGCERTKAWANEFMHLSELEIGSEAYNSTLARLSHFVVRSGAAPERPNQSALGQLRTNEIGLSGAWQMREYHLDASTGFLKQTTLADTFRHHGRSFSKTRNTPRPASLRGTGIMFNEIQENMTSILDGRYTMPEVTSHGKPLLSGGVTLLSQFGRYDDHKLRSHDQRAARFSVGVNTCDGCHTAETGTNFYHIFPNRPGRPTRFSAYLQNSPHRSSHLNHMLRLEHHEFDETKARVQALHGMANQVCAVERGIVPVQMTEAPLKRVH